jgi:hypothetical protein
MNSLTGSIIEREWRKRYKLLLLGDSLPNLGKV